MKDHTPPHPLLTAALGTIWIGRREVARIGWGGHEFDPNGVCYNCSRCVDRACCDIKDKCPHDELRRP